MLQVDDSDQVGADWLDVVADDHEWAGALLSCCAPFTTAEFGTINLRGRDGRIREVWRWRFGWSWLLDGSEHQGRLGWSKRKRLGAAVDAMVARHPGERALWLRFSAPSRELLMRSLHHWRQYRKDHGLELDAVRVIDQGPDGEHVWHVHILGFGIAVDLAVEPSVIERAGGYGFIKTEWVDASSRKSYLLRRLRGYIGAKESGWRRLRVCGARAADAESVALADRAKLSDLRSRFGDSGEQVHGRVLRFVLIGSRGRVQVLAESLASRTGGGLRGAEYWRSRNVGRIES